MSSQVSKLYDRIKEQNDFDNIFKPISDEDLKDRLRKRLERSDYEYAYAGNVEGEAGWACEEDLGTVAFADALVHAVRLTREADVDIDLEIKVFNTSVVTGFGVIGSFSGSFVALSNWELDEDIICDIISDYAGGEAIEITDIKITNLKEIKKNDQIEETKAIRKLYTDAGLTPPNGKGIHTKSFHKCVVGVLSGNKDMDYGSAAAICMKKLGRDRCVKKEHRSDKK